MCCLPRLFRDKSLFSCQNFRLSLLLLLFRLLCCKQGCLLHLQYLFRCVLWVMRFSPNSEVILPCVGQTEGIEGFAESSGIIYSSGSNSAVRSIKGRISVRAKYHCLWFSSKSSVISSSERIVMFI